MIVWVDAMPSCSTLFFLEFWESFGLCFHTASFLDTVEGV